MLKGTSHPGSQPPGGFRETANGGEYAFTVVHIGGIFQNHLCICVKLPAASWWRYDYK